MYLSRTVLKIRFDHLTGFPYFPRSSAFFPSTPLFRRLVLSPVSRTHLVSNFVRETCDKQFVPRFPVPPPLSPYELYARLAADVGRQRFLHTTCKLLNGISSGTNYGISSLVARPFRPFPSSLHAHGSRREPAIPSSNVSRHRETVDWVGASPRSTLSVLNRVLLHSCRPSTL